VFFGNLTAASVIIAASAEGELLAYSSSLHQFRDMKLRQGQIWQQAAEFIHIVQVDRRQVQFKIKKEPTAREGALRTLGKKEFCRLLKTAVLMAPAESRATSD
jgi:hypothetical protein